MESSGTGGGATEKKVVPLQESSVTSSSIIIGVVVAVLGIVCLVAMCMAYRRYRKVKANKVFDLENFYHGESSDDDVNVFNNSTLGRPSFVSLERNSESAIGDRNAIINVDNGEYFTETSIMRRNDLFEMSNPVYRNESDFRFPDNSV